LIASSLNTKHIHCLFLLLLPLQLQQPSYLAGILLTFHQLAPEKDKLTELRPQSAALNNNHLAQLLPPSQPTNLRTSFHCF
jgi:hypothetical protein